MTVYETEGIQHEWLTPEHSARMMALEAELAEAKARIKELHLCLQISQEQEEYLTAPEMVEELRQLLADSMSTHKALAKRIGISPQFFCDILKGKRNLGVGVCKFLHIEPVLVYRAEKKVKNDNA